MEASELLYRLVDDTCSRLEPHERLLKKCSTEVLIYNLFKSDYAFSYKVYVDLMKLLKLRDAGSEEYVIPAAKAVFMKEKPEKLPLKKVPPERNLLTGEKCFYCERETTIKGKLRKTKDHVHPKSKGGKAGDNLVIACAECNGLKKDMTLDSFILYLKKQIVKKTTVSIDLGGASKLERILANAQRYRGYDN